MLDFTNLEQMFVSKRVHRKNDRRWGIRRTPLLFDCLQINQLCFPVFLLKRVTSAVDIFMNLVHLVWNLFAIHIYIINS